MNVTTANFKDRLYLSTVSDDAAEVARACGLGLELIEFCDAPCMDERFSETDARVRRLLEGAERRMLHAPFGELCPAAVDPLIADVARRRFSQAADLLSAYGMSRMVVHTGFLPRIYDPEWFVERSILFWREFLRERSVRGDGELTLLLENVFEDSPALLLAIASGVSDSRFRLCLDIGHANLHTGENVSRPQDPRRAASINHWIDEMAPFLAHVHVHNNDGVSDRHADPDDGVLDVLAAIRRIRQKAPDATFTAENRNAAAAVRWFKENALLEIVI